MGVHFITSTYNITNGAKGVTNTGAGFTAVTAAQCDLYIKVVSASATFTVKIDYWGGAPTGCSGGSSSSSSSSSGGGSTCSATTFNKTATKAVDLAASVGDCVKFAHPSGTLQIGSWGGATTTYNITGGAQGVTNTGAAFTSVAGQATGDLYIKIVTAPANYSVKFDYW